MEMTTEELDKGVTKIDLNGRLDVVSTGQIELRFSAIAGARRAVIVDLSQVTFLASMGMRMLLIGAKTMASKGGKMVLLAPVAEVAAVLKTARLDSLIPIYDQRDAAFAAVAGVGV
jgi:anti-sigma B factor antagonist